MYRVTIEADDETVTTDRVHGLTVGEKVEFVQLAGGTGLTGRALGATGHPTRYFVRTVPTSKTLTVSATLGGGAVNVTADATRGFIRRYVRAPGDV